MFVTFEENTGAEMIGVNAGIKPESRISFCAGGRI
jgi:hypothetical protein